MLRCFSCGGNRLKDVRDIEDDDMPIRSSDSSENGSRKSSLSGKVKESSSQKGNMARSFTFRELSTATRNFKETNLIGEGGFGRVFKGHLDSGQASDAFPTSISFIVAIKQLNRDGFQGNQEFIVEVLMLSLLHHPNLVNLIGYCSSGDQRLLVYEYMRMGSLEGHLFDIEPDKEPLDWSTGIKIAFGAAQGLEYLHCKANPPVIYRDLKSANILLDENFYPKLSDFGLAKLGPVGDNTHVSTRVVGTFGYCAPEYAMSGKLTLKSDIYSFGVVLLELITGRKAIVLSRKAGEQNLVVWSRPFLKDPKNFIRLADPMLQGRFHVRTLCHAVAITAMCLQESANFRPFIGDIVVALEYLASQSNKKSSRGVPRCPPSPSPSPSPSKHSSGSFSRDRDFGSFSSI
ncbi:hypothetical protein RHMOL_Rhmol07G0053700 [Rhododendron molle]|uniref:Uncharacterized protein n=2 Tax=Rhododendron molle TaxID=49168 RepID=A0ACC0MYH0_RHOML|nr:hypothetical protein RHMOL_Rhmol07G0053700 [Rhododendron molle]KAI8545620.1 hypothetical protein RHMOL_Rhmol07G0053700 [Rhododendron molle]